MRKDIKTDNPITKAVFRGHNLLNDVKAKARTRYKVPPMMRELTKREKAERRRF